MSLPEEHRLDVLTDIRAWKDYIHHPDRIHTTMWLGDNLHIAERLIDRLTSQLHERRKVERDALRATIKPYVPRALNNLEACLDAILSLTPEPAGWMPDRAPWKELEQVKP